MKSYSGPDGGEIRSLIACQLRCAKMEAKMTAGDGRSAWWLMTSKWSTSTDMGS